MTVSETLRASCVTRPGFRRRCVAACCGLLVLTVAVVGCRSTPNGPKSELVDKFKKSSRKDTNVPPRHADVAADGGQKREKTVVSEDAISLTEFESGTSAVELSGATVVARVNAIPIFAEDVLEPFAPGLAKAAQEIPPAELNKLRARVIKENLAPHIEKAALVGAMRQSLKKDDLGRLDEQLDKLWNEQEIESLQQRYKVGSRVELERLLEEQGTTLSNLKTGFKSRELAMYYMGQKTKDVGKLGPKELRAWYDEHLDQFKIEAKARWQQIHVSHKKNGGRNGSLKLFNQAIEALRDGQDFADVAKEFSDGPNAAEGGLWDWTVEGSLANAKINRALAELPEGRISSPIDTGDAWVLVKVLERSEAGHRPFEAVQGEIKGMLSATTRRDAADQTIRELIETANIWTIFDQEKAAAAPASRRR